MLKGVIIDGVDTLAEYGFCVLAEISVGAPALRRNTVEIPGGDGVVDLSYIYGKPIYNERTITFNLFSRLPEAEFERARRMMFRKWHGRKVTVRLPSDPTRYWYGSLEFGATGNFGGNTIPVTLYAEPFARFEQKRDTFSIAASGTKTLSWDNPLSAAGFIKITNTKTIIVTFTNCFTEEEGDTITLAPGEHGADTLFANGLAFLPGANTIAIRNYVALAATVTVEIEGREL